MERTIPNLCGVESHADHTLILIPFIMTTDKLDGRFTTAPPYTGIDTDGIMSQRLSGDGII